MSDYIRGYEKTMKAANLQIFTDERPYSLGAMGKETDRNYLPYALPMGVAPAAVGGAAVGSVVGGVTGGVTGKGFGGHLLTAIKKGPVTAVNEANTYRKGLSSVNNLNNIDRMRIGRAGLGGALTGVIGAGGLKAISNASSYSAGHTLAPGPDGNVFFRKKKPEEEPEPPGLLEGLKQRVGWD